MAKEVGQTPMMKQFYEMKAKHPDALLLYRVGDFYETYGPDAIIASEILGITLTRRSNGTGGKNLEWQFCLLLIFHNNELCLRFFLVEVYQMIRNLNRMGSHQRTFLE